MLPRSREVQAERLRTAQPLLLQQLPVIQTHLFETSTAGSSRRKKIRPLPQPRGPSQERGCPPSRRRERLRCARS